MSEMRYWPRRLEAWLGAHLMARILRLPEGVLRRLAGTVPAEATGLHPEAWLIARADAAGPDRMSDEAPVAEQRFRMTVQSRALGYRRELPVTTEDVRAGGVPARLYVPAEAGADTPLLVYFHGGGWVQGSVSTHDLSVRLLAVLSGVRVLSVDYRLAPEHPYPAAVEDAVAAYRWAAERFAGVPLAVGGDSAGGTQAAVLALVARDDEALPDPVFQLLLYPVTDVAAKSASYTTYASGYLLTEAGMDWFTGKYFPDGLRKDEWQASPLRAEDLSGLPPAYVATCVPDVLRDEGEAYAARLRQAGVPVALQRHGLLHGFFNMSASRSSQTAIAQIAGALRVGVSAKAPRTSAPAGTL